ncbi:unnamed protein product [Dicrocoelium dendriticum]|nr:unnamed protein product [Dicrocoelium dendriticum]
MDSAPPGRHSRFWIPDGLFTLPTERSRTRRAPPPYSVRRRSLTAQPVSSSSHATFPQLQLQWAGAAPLAIVGYQRVLKLLRRYVSRYVAAQAESELTSRFEEHTAALDHWLRTSLDNTGWPSTLGWRLVLGLRERMQFTVHLDTMLRNCTTSLDLSYYPLVTNEMVFCLASRWHHMTELRLHGLHEDQVSVDAVAEIHRLQYLRFLSLDGLRAVCDENIFGILCESLLELPILSLQYRHVQMLRRLCILRSTE